MRKSAERAQLSVTLRTRSAIHTLVRRGVAIISA